MYKRLISTCVVGVIAAGSTGCASKAPPPTGFLSDYGTLENADDGAMRYVSPEFAHYSSFIIDPVEFRATPGKSKLNPKEQAELARHFNDSLVKALAARGYQVVDRPDVGVARVRLALTDVQESTWWLNLHPASKLSGAGTGGAAMEGEVIDSVTGRQLGAVIQTGKGSQFELDTFAKYDDVKDAIDKWAATAGMRLDELRATR